MNLLKKDYEPFKRYCHDHDLVIKDELAKALHDYLKNKAHKEKQHDTG